MLLLFHKHRVCCFNCIIFYLSHITLEVIVDAFLESGLTSEEELRKQRLKNLVGQFDWKTHATVLNTRYRR